MKDRLEKDRVLTEDEAASIGKPVFKNFLEKQCLFTCHLITTERGKTSVSKKTAEDKMSETAIQDLYQDRFANCYGCGRNNPHGLQLKSYWQGEECICRYTPELHYTGGVPGFLYGGMIASLLDCHGAATAAAAKSRESVEPVARFVTAALNIDFRKPTPLGVELEIRGQVSEMKGRKVTVTLQLFAGETLCASARMIVVQLPGEPNPVDGREDEGCPASS